MILVLWYGVSGEVTVLMSPRHHFLKFEVEVSDQNI